MYSERSVKSKKNKGEEMKEKSANDQTIPMTRAKVTFKLKLLPAMAFLYKGQTVNTFFIFFI